MSDYSDRFTKRVKTSGDLQITAGSDVCIEPEGELNVSSGKDLNLSSAGNMTFSDADSSATLRQMVNETVHAEYVMRGQVSASGINRYLDVFEQTFVGTSDEDYVEIALFFLVQDTTGGDALDVRYKLQLDTNDGGYVEADTIAFTLNGVTAAYSVPVTFKYTISLGTDTVKTRLVQSTAPTGVILNSASFFSLKHVTKHHPYTLYGGGSWQSV